MPRTAANNEKVWSSQDIADLEVCASIGDSAAEIAALWSYLEDRLVRLANRTAFHRQRLAPRTFGRRSDAAVGEDAAGLPQEAVA